MKKVIERKSNRIIDQLKAAGGADAQKLTGFIGAFSAGRLQIYSDLSMTRCIDIAEADVVHIVDAEQAMEPSMVFVRKEAPVSIRFETTALNAADMDLGSCSCEVAPSPYGTIARRKDGSTGSRDLDCAIARMKCLLSIGLDDPNKAIKEQACENSYSRCRTPIWSAGGGGLFIF